MRYPGGKGRVYQRIISLMRPHAVYIESHLGGGAVFRHKRPAASSIGVDADERVLDRWRAGMQDGIRLIHGDAAAFLRNYPFNGEELVYADPPYVPETRRRSRVYRFDYTVEQHVELIEVLRGVPAGVLISGYPSALYDGLLRGWRRVEFPGDSHTGPRTEAVWINHDPPRLLHDPSFIGGSFHERERIRRKRERMAGRIASLPDAERQALLCWLASALPDDMRFAVEGRTP